MTLDYATLTRTPSGALTAASKRALAADEAEQAKLRRAKFFDDQAHREAVADFESATDDYEEAGGADEMEARTDREERIVERAVAGARQDWENDYRDDMRMELEAAVDLRIDRIRYLGLDTDLTALEVLERLRDEVAAP